MPKIIAPLSELKIKNAKPKQKSYKLFDGGGLYLEVKPSGKKVWRVKYRFNGKEKTYTIGEYPIIPLTKARGILQEIKAKIIEGVDPNLERKQNIEKEELSNKKMFKNIVEEFLELKKQQWSENYTKKQIRRIEIYILPFIGDYPIDKITKGQLVELIKNVKNIQTPTTKVSNKAEVTRRIYLILKQLYTFAMHNDYIDVNIPEKIDINNLITKEETKHFAAITNTEELRKLYKDILSYPSLAKYALQFLALTALRPGNIRTLMWEWIDWDKKIIVIPKDHMKTRIPYRLPLTDSLIEILEEMKKYSLASKNSYVFCSPVNFSKKISENTLNDAIKKMGYNHKAHGWRASFSTFAYEHQQEHGFSAEVIETQLAHVIGSKVTRAYMRSDFLEERRELLKWWDKFLTANSF